VQGCEEALFEWAESYDTKDWGRLANCIAPTLRIDYRSVMSKIWEEMPANDFVQLASNPHFLGNPLIKTQHFIGGAKLWIKNSSTSITSCQQMRVAHQKYEDESLTRVAFKGHAHGISCILYTKVDNVWKLAGIEPRIRWGEYDVDKIFH
ncbi:unnamed protein product, partial [Clonostachys rosea f. rosea IK726]